jgi:hypothetical protein
MTIKYPSINQFKNVIRTVKDKTCYRGKDDNDQPIFVDATLPVISFTGAVKIHGTNAAWRYHKADDTVTAQSRERDLSLTSDNAGFCAYTLKNIDLIKQFCKDIVGDNDLVVVYGEWAGKGIQSGVAVSQLDKMFILFGIRVRSGDTETWLDTHEMEYHVSVRYALTFLNENSIYLITQFPTYSIDIDFNDPSAVQNQIIDMTIAVETECPVGKYFGVSGVGEGIVWSHNSDEHGFLQFKVKGEKHSNSKVKVLVPVDEEAFAKVKDFVDAYVTEARLNQGIHVMKSEMQLEPIDKNVGSFLKWVVSDTIKEEQQSIVANDLDPKKVAKEISNVARKWFFEHHG